jgi:MFS family permease
MHTDSATSHEPASETPQPEDTYGTGTDSDTDITAPLEVGPSSSDGAVHEVLRQLPRRGLYAQYFSVGLVCGALPGTLYGYFMGYLDVESHVYATAVQVVSLPWSFKFLYGMVNDCLPIAGSHRKAYMVIGWTLCTLSLVALAQAEEPEQGQRSAAGTIAVKMAIAAVGYMMADVAADALVVQYAKTEHIDVRGTLQANVYLARTIGSIAAALLIGLCLNGREYNGTFDWTLTFRQVCALLALQSAAMVPISWVYITEPESEPRLTPRAYLRLCYEALQSRAMFCVAIYSISHGVIGGISTTSAPNVTKVWAGVHTLQAQMFAVLAMAIFAVGLVLVKKYLLQTNWRHVIAGTTVLLTVVDAFFVYCTIYDIVRDQYFYLGESAVVMVPAAAKFLVTSFVVVELAEDGQEGMVYGLLTTLHNLGGPIARGLSNTLYGVAFDGLSDAVNYKKDTASFRDTVAYSYAVAYGCGLSALLLLYYLPSQKAQTHAWKELPRKTWYARTTVVVLVVSWTYALAASALAMHPSTSCLKVAGGSGC